ncbi:protein angel homolog 2 isoform X2 [Planococcus citri]|uniref:protein angel homolog 2 isoform X2 n=1 Tax=Planococcus citri TaxID=170843 RepID=UPI0031F9CFAA
MIATLTYVYWIILELLKSLKQEKTGTDLKQFLAEARQDVYTPYGEWIKEGGRNGEARGDFIKVLSYNILSQNLLEMHPHLYKNHDERYLDWEYRKEALLKEFQEFDADVLCLQEVEGKETEFFNTHLEALGYKGIYKKRTNDKEDGCAIYYRVEKFDLKEYATVEYYQPGIQLLNRDNIGLIARLSPKNNPDRNIVFANTHLLFNPNRHDIKLAQVQILLAEIDRVAYRSSINNTNRYTPYHPVILVGDFNLKPFTHVYKFLVSGYLEDIQCTSRNRRYSDFANPNQLMPVHLGITDACQHYEVVRNRVQSRTEISDFKFVRLFNSDRKSLSFSDEQLGRKERMNYRHFGSGCLYHHLNLTSVYPHDQFRGNNATTFQDDWCNVDYIFYGPGRSRNGSKHEGELKLVSYLRLPTKEEAEVLKAIPNEACASDHLPLLATFFLPS